MEAKLTAEHRTTVRKGLGPLRRGGLMPAVLYGADKKPVALQLNSREAGKTLNRLVGTVLIDLTVNGQPHKTLVREIQRNFVTDEILHVDFYEVDMNRTMRVSIPVRLVGAAPAVVTLGGILVRGLAEIEIECLPGDLMNEVSVDLGVLKEINNSIHVSDLVLPSTIKVLTHADEQVARVTYASQEELTTEKPETAAEVEVVEKGKKEEEGEEEE
ncbi:MAG: 50S ribosomal protein L25 [Chloroflexi bacterium]|nr:50S ribosomal protein L25 [Chloroflexota bacterium]